MKLLDNNYMKLNHFINRVLSNYLYRVYSQLQIKRKLTDLIAYLYFNTIFILSSFLIAFFIPGEASASLSNSLSAETMNVVVPVLLAIVTIVVTLELLIKQVFFKRFSIRYFSHTIRNLVSVFLFFVILLLFVFSISDRFYNALCLTTISATIIELLFFASDILLLDVDRLIERIKDNVLLDIAELNNPDQHLLEFNNLLNEFLLYSDVGYAEKMCSMIPDIYNRYLEKIREAQNRKSDDPFKNLNKGIFKIYMSIVKTINNLSKSKINEIATLNLSKMIDRSLSYNDKESTDFLTELTDVFFEKIQSQKELWELFVKSLLSSKCETIYETIIWLDGFYDDALCFHGLSIEPFALRLAHLINDEKVVVDKKIMDISFKFASELVSNNEMLNSLAIYLLNTLWGKLPKDLYEQFVKKLSYDDNCYSVFSNVSKKETFSVVNYVLNECIAAGNYRPDYIREIQLNNICIRMHFGENTDSFLSVDLKADDLRFRADLIKDIYHELVAVGKRNDVYYGLNELNTIICSLSAKETDIIKKGLDIYVNAVDCADEIKSEEKISAISDQYSALLYLLDENKLVNNKFVYDLLDNYFEIISGLLSDDSKLINHFYNYVGLFNPFTCKLSFINSAKKTELVDYITENIYSIAINAIENGQYEIVKYSSNHIGWVSLFYLKDKNLSYERSLGELAYNLIDNLILFNCEEMTIYFVATLFVINMSYCTLFGKSDDRYIFFLSLMKKMPINLLKIIEKVTVFRQKSTNDFNEYFDNRYEEAISNFRILIAKEIKNKSKGN